MHLILSCYVVFLKFFCFYFNSQLLICSLKYHCLTFLLWKYRGFIILRSFLKQILSQNISSNVFMLWEAGATITHLCETWKLIFYCYYHLKLPLVNGCRDSKWVNSSFNWQTQIGLFYMHKTETGSRWYFNIILK